MKQKGFTLIELLAVIVILAVIALIATPTILGVIESAKKGALENSAYGVLEAASMYYARNSTDFSTKEFVLENGSFVSGTESLKTKGSLKGTGNLIIAKNGELTLCLNSDNHYAYKNYDATKVTVGSGDVCKVENDILINKYVTYLAGNGSTIDGYYTKDQVNDLLKNYISKENIEEYIGNNTKVGELYTKSNIINIGPRATWTTVPSATWTLPAGTWVIDFEFSDLNTGTGIWAFNLGDFGISDTVWKSSSDYHTTHFSWVRTYDTEKTGAFSYYQQISSTARNITFKMTAVRIK